MKNLPVSGSFHLPLREHRGAGVQFQVRKNHARRTPHDPLRTRTRCPGRLHLRRYGHPLLLRQFDPAAVLSYGQDQGIQGRRREVGRRGDRLRQLPAVERGRLPHRRRSLQSRGRQNGQDAAQTAEYLRGGARRTHETAEILDPRSQGRNGDRIPLPAHVGLHRADSGRRRPARNTGRTQHGADLDP